MEQTSQNNINKTPNYLINETSPYLLQHAYNPVEWYPWGETALQRALQENKPILISIGYAACHWCHVMERESFENVAVAAYMNEHFINIKVDREERPDLDHLYMDAVQAMTGQGGWPLNVFLLPDTRPFFGGTYFPPSRVYQRPSWQEVLESVVHAFNEQQTDLFTQADNLINHLEQQNLPLTLKQRLTDDPDENNKSVLDQAREIRAAVMQTADTRWGGFGHAPKFPQSLTIRYLLRDYYYTGNEQSAQQALLSLDKMIQGGIYDQIGGGFARYSTDEKWLVPHFEKMLYDNALILEALTEAWSLTGNPAYEITIRQTVDFLTREMLHTGGGFYAALDADSEGIEGKYYVWQKQEIERILGPEAELFCLVYDVEERGNWEDSNILWLPQSIQEVARNIKIPPSSLLKVIQRCQQKLLNERIKREPPGKDDKIILGWNAMLITALCKCGASLNNPIYIQLAENCYQFLATHLLVKDTGGKSSWRHHWNKKVAESGAFLDDYALLIQALIDLNAVTGKQDYLYSAADLTKEAITNFSDEQKNFFYYTDQQAGALVRKIDTYDNATPSGNSVMADNLWRLSILLDKSSWRERAIYMIKAMEPLFNHYPTSFGYWGTLWQKVAFGTPEIAVIGEDAASLALEISKHYIPGALIQQNSIALAELPLLAGKNVPKGQSFIYLCQDYHCNQPVTESEALLNSLIKSGVHPRLSNSNADPAT